MPNFTLPIKTPIDGPYRWDKFGVVRPKHIDPSGKPHDGLDLRSKFSRDVFAIDDGRVIVSTGELGSYIAIDHADGYRSIYAHLTQRLLSPGYTVKKGQKIGVYGVIGVSTGAHLHFMIRKNGVAIDPEPLIFNQNNNSNMFDRNKAFNDFAKRWNGKLESWWADDGNDFGSLRARWYKGEYDNVFDQFGSHIQSLQRQLAEAPESAVIEQLQAKDEEINQLELALDERIKELDRTEKDRMRLYNLIQELESKPEPEPAEKFDWNKFIVGLSKDQTFQRGLRHTITFAIGVLASQFPEYAPYILGLAGVWGLGTEVQAFQVNQKQIAKEEK